MKKSHSLFFKYVFPSILGMVGISCYILVDTFFVALALGKTGLVALNISIPIFSFFIGFAMLIGIGGATLFSINKSRDIEQSRTYFKVAVILGAIISLVFMSMSLFVTPLASLMGATEAIVPYAVDYMFIAFIGAPFYVFNNILSAFIRNDNSPRFAMSIVLIGSVVNIVLDYIFIFPLGWGMFGASFATVISQIVIVAMLLTHFFKKTNTLKLSKLPIKLRMVASTLRVGVPTFINEISTGIIILMMNIVIGNIIGDIGIASYGIIANVAVVVIAVMNGIGHGIQPIVSQAYGKGDKKTVREILIMGMITALTLATIIYICLYVFSAPIINIFNSENDMTVTLSTLPALRLYFLGAFPCSLAIVFSAYFYATNRSMFSTIVSFCRGFMTVLPVLLIMSSIFGETGIWLSIPLAESVAFLVGLTLIILSSRKSNRTLIRATN